MNARRIEFSGGSVHVSMVCNERPTIVLYVLGWEDGTTVALSPAVARQVAQALTEYALAAEQAAASSAVSTTSQPASPLPAPAPAKHAFVRCPEYDTSCVHFNVPRRIACHLDGCGKLEWHEVHA